MPPAATPVVTALLVLGVISSPVLSQRRGQLEATPQVGLYLPLATLVEVVDPGSGVGVTFEQQTALALGGRVGYWLSARVALEGTVMFVPGDIKLTILGAGTPPPTQAEGSRVLSLGARVRYQWPVGRVAVHLLGGVAAVSRYGNFWDLLEQSGLQVTGRTDVAGVVGAGIAVPVCSGFEFRVEVEDYLHSAKFTIADGVNPPENTDSRMQHDILLAVGLAIGLHRF